MARNSSNSSGGGVKRKGVDDRDLSLTGLINGFTAKLYKSIEKDKLSSNNLNFSGFDVISVFGILGLGTRGTTRKEIFQKLGFPLPTAGNGAGGDAINNGDYGSRYKSLMDSFKVDSAKKLRSGPDDVSGSTVSSPFTLVAARKIYVQSGFNLNPQFANVMKKYFDIEPEILDFSTHELRKNAVKRINSWMATATEKKIEEIVTEDDLKKNNAKMLIVNGLYFKATWKNHFVQEEGLQNFNVTASKQVQVKMESFEDHYYYRDLPDLDARALAVPYKGDRWSMVIILPNAIDGLQKIQNGIQDLLEINGRSRLTKDSMDNSILPARELTWLVPLKMPEYGTSSNLGSMKIIMEKLGIESTLSSRDADLSGFAVIEGDVTDNSLNNPFVIETFQEAFIKSAYETDGAAVTATAEGTAGCIDPPPKRVPFDVDRPFYYQIVDHQNDDLVLVAGHVYDPSTS